MRLVIIADVYPPLRSSGAVQLRDLTRELVNQGHEVSMLVSSPELETNWVIENFQGVRVVRLRTLGTKDISYARRTINEFLMPFAMQFHLRNCPVADEKWDGIIWYSPSIFHGPFVKALKHSSQCPSYLIVRDIFPEWAVDMGLMSRGLPYHILKMIAEYQYSVADVIGIQTIGNASYFKHWLTKPGRKLEVLQNWLANAPDSGCSIRLADTTLADRRILVYAGNMGVAQGMDILIHLAESLISNKNIGFLFIGRGSDTARLQNITSTLQLDNVIFFDEIEPNEIPGLYAQCHIGLVALDPRHKSHNIPGKFLSYLQAGLPVLASINPGNDMAALIETEQVGKVCTDSSIVALKTMTEMLIKEIEIDDAIKERCINLSQRLFSPETAVGQIVKALEK